MLDEACVFLGRATNNVAEYRGLLLGLERAQALGATEVDVVNDSELIAYQVTGRYKVKHPDMKPLHAEALAALRAFENWSVKPVKRAQNADADALVNQCLDAQCGLAPSDERDGSFVAGAIQWAVTPLCVLAAAAPAAGAAVRPGPDVLYEKPARAPQLSNAKPFRANRSSSRAPRPTGAASSSTRTSSTTATARQGRRDSVGPVQPIDFLFSPKAGTLTYPSDAAFANDAADLVEVRVKPRARATLFRVTFNVLHPQTGVHPGARASASAGGWPPGPACARPPSGS